MSELIPDGETLGLPAETPADARRRKDRERKRQAREARRLEVPVEASEGESETPKRGKSATRKAPSSPVTGEQYAEVFQAMHMLASGATGYTALIVSDAEAAPVGRALKTCADYYGWDFLEKFGPGFFLALTVGSLEAKVFGRVRAERPRIAAAKRAKRGESRPAVIPEIVTPDSPPPDPEQGKPPSHAQALRMAEAMIHEVPDLPEVDLQG